MEVLIGWKVKMISFTNVYINPDGSIDEQDLINDINACKILMLEYKRRGDKIQETLVRYEFAKRKSFAVLHNIEYNIPAEENSVSV